MYTIKLTSAQVMWFLPVAVDYMTMCTVRALPQGRFKAQLSYSPSPSPGK